ncbi:hypothetical protein FUT79_06270 [Treponema phagedenis]|uniref:hypothetical protein n=1 Tax=Treponema phagedenis TaxID=162 RepID=UPI0011E812A2|nr:hypothetical protein [Treponema phagedenis]QEJ94851.1 hypothetical protein FUT79_06270 [Treponema phagedenis]
MFLKNVLYIKPFFDFLLPFILASSVSDLKTDIMRGLELSYYFADDPDLAAWFLTHEQDGVLGDEIKTTMKQLASREGFFTSFAANMLTNHYYTISNGEVIFETLNP